MAPRDVIDATKSCSVLDHQDVEYPADGAEDPANDDESLGDDAKALVDDEEALHRLKKH